MILSDLEGDELRVVCTACPGQGGIRGIVTLAKNRRFSNEAAAIAFPPKSLIFLHVVFERASRLTSKTRERDSAEQSH
jgi:hypothetical protein